MRPYKYQQHAYFERYNRTIRYDWLARVHFPDISEVQDCAIKWLRHYNNERSDMGIGGIIFNQKLFTLLLSSLITVNEADASDDVTRPTIKLADTVR